MSYTPCYKKPYPSRIDALIALWRIQTKDRDSCREKRAYLCDSCARWHLTSQELEYV